MSSVAAIQRNTYIFNGEKTPSNDQILQAIDANDKETAVSILKQTNSINQPLSNGELPLVYAIRKGKIELVEHIFNELPHVDATNKDARHQLTPLEHAAITQNKQMIMLVLGHIMGSSFENLAKNSFNRTDLVRFQKIEKDVQTWRAGPYLFRLPPLHKAAREGNLEQVKAHFSLIEVNSYDRDGMTPLHHAFLAGKKDVAAWLIQNGARVDVLTKNRQSLLHLAAIRGDASFLSLLPKADALDMNDTDTNGLTPLYYAISGKDLAVIRAFIARGANPCQPTSPNGPTPRFSPLEMLHFSLIQEAKTKDPLRLSFSEWHVFAGIASSWVSSYCGGISALDTYFSLTQSLQIFLVFKSLKTWKSRLAYVAANLITAGVTAKYAAEWFLGNGNTAGLRVSLALWLSLRVLECSLIAKNSLEGLSACWKNRSLEPLRATRNAIVHSVIGLSTGRNLIDSAKIASEGFGMIDAWDQYEGREAFQNPPNCQEDLECIFNVKVGILNHFYQDYFKPASPIFDSTSCIEPKAICQDLRLVDCLVKLDPQSCASHRQHIANLGTYRELSRQYHPDKCNRQFSEETCTQAFQNIATAFGK